MQNNVHNHVYSRIFSVSAVLLFNTLQGVDTEVTTKLSLLNQNNHIRSEITELLSLCNISHDGSLQDIIKATQKAQDQGGWMRKASCERWELSDVETDPVKTKKFKDLFSKLGMVGEIFPQKTFHKYAVIHGGNIVGVRQRLAKLIRAWNAGARFENLIIFSGQRDLDPKIENEETLYTNNNSYLVIKADWQQPTAAPCTEYEMMRMVFDQTEFPAGFEKIHQVWVNAPKIQNADGTLRRPTTGDTIKLWLTQCPEPGDILAISNQPYVGYQHACLLTYLPDTFCAETVGSQASEDIKRAILFDTLARWLYQEQEYQKSRQKQDASA